VTSKQFITYVFAGVAAVAAFVIPLNMYADIYGLFRPAAGRHVFVSGEARTAKYLHSFRYIPSNFDGVLLGSSVSENMQTKEFSTYRIYNASINGGNIEDVKPIADNIFHNGNLKVTILCIHRYLTNDHAKKTDLMTPKQYWGALGSPQLLTAYLSRAAVRFGMASGKFDEYGAADYGPDPRPQSVQKSIATTVEELQRGQASVGNYYVDPVALADLKDVITTARLHSRQLIIVYPPVPAPVFALRSSEYSHYRNTIDSLLYPQDIVVDFNDAAYQEMRNNPVNFADAVHLSRTGAAAVVAEVDKVLEKTASDRSASLQ
jgi:hypothetical protein